jgi:ribonuclease P/MRP protein subunit RPP40
MEEMRTCRIPPGTDWGWGESLRDLGIQMSDDAKFSEKINHVSSKVWQKCCWILRTFSCRKLFFMKFLCKTLVQGHIDYCSQLYFPTQSKELEILENLQKNFSKKIPEIHYLDYWNRLKHLQLYSQQRRSEGSCIIYTWKVLEGMVPNCGIQHIQW